MVRTMLRGRRRWGGCGSGPKALRWRVVVVDVRGPTREGRSTLVASSALALSGSAALQIYLAVQSAVDIRSAMNWVAIT